MPRKDCRFSQPKLSLFWWVIPAINQQWLAAGRLPVLTQVFHRDRVDYNMVECWWVICIGMQFGNGIPVSIATPESRETKPTFPSYSEGVTLGSSLPPPTYPGLFVLGLGQLLRHGVLLISYWTVVISLKIQSFHWFRKWVLSVN